MALELQTLDLGINCHNNHIGNRYTNRRYVWEKEKGYSQIQCAGSSLRLSLTWSLGSSTYCVRTDDSTFYPTLANKSNSITAYPKLNFIVVVNPNSGPGSEPLPDGNYTREIPRLNAHANVRTVGYVSTNYGKRDLKTMVKDVDVYSAWAEHALTMHGIFLDETPSLYDLSAASAYEQLATEIRTVSGLGPDPLVSILVKFRLGPGRCVVCLLMQHRSSIILARYRMLGT